MLRFIAGFGLAGELGVALSWISESFDKQQRTIATMIVSAVGLCGGITAGIVGSYCSWQTSYMTGGIMGLLLLLMRISVTESKIFNESKTVSINRGSLLQLFGNRQQLSKFLLCIFSGAPAFVFMSIYITLAPEFCHAFGIPGTVSVSKAIMIFFISFAISDILCGLLSKLMKKRKAPLLIYAGIQVLAVIFFLLIKPQTIGEFYNRCVFLGFSVGYWGILITNSVEQFGTNLRATVATSTPNLIRGITVPVSMVFSLLIGYSGFVEAGAIMGFSLIAISVVCILLLRDKFENDLVFYE